MKIVIIGGVAGGASCAARLRHLDESAEIILLEKESYISYANCGLPYHVSGVIEEESDLLLFTPELMHSRFQIDVRVNNEVTAIHRNQKTVSILRKDTNETYEESYDKLVIATGSSPLRPSIPGIDSDLIKTIWTVPDTIQLKQFVQLVNIQNVVIVGGGFIGLEMAENLKEHGKEVTILEASNQVMAPLDYEMAQILHKHIQSKGVTLQLEDAVSSFEEKENKITITLSNGKQVLADFVILAIGVRPNSQLAKEAELQVNERGGIIVNEHMQTNDPDIYAVGDVVEVQDFVLKISTMVPLADPANKQGRIVSDNLAGIPSVYKGTQGSSIAKVFDLAVASTGANEKTLQKNHYEKGKDYDVVILSQGSHAGYYPGSKTLTIKLLFQKDGSKILGAQIVGEDGVNKRIDTIAVALRLGATIQDLKDLELSYAPPFSSAKDPVNMAGFVAVNQIQDLTTIAAWNEIELDPEAIVLDVREASEVAKTKVEGSIHIPLGQLRNHLDELDKSKRYIIMCAVGVRAHSASRILKQHGFSSVKVYPGGMRFYNLTH